MEDRYLGTIGLLLSFCALGYMLFYLTILPILPLSEDCPLAKSLHSNFILGLCGFFSFSVIGTLLMYTFCILKFSK